MNHRWLFTTIALCLSSTTALCQQQDCSKALIEYHRSGSSSLVSTLSAAYSMSEGEWSKRQQGGNANVVVYGVPLGASYQDFKERVSQRAEQFHIDRFDARAQSYAESDLSNNGLEAYKACLRGNRGFELFAGDTSANTYTIHLLNQPAGGLDARIIGSLETPVNLSDQSADYLRRKIAGLHYAQAWDQAFVIQPRDPKQEVSFTVDFGDAFSKSIVLPPLQIKPPRVELSNSTTFSLMHRVNGVPRQDCALGTPRGGEGGLPTDYVADERATLSIEGKQLPSNFKIDQSTVTITAPGQACAWVVCPEASEEEAKHENNKNITDATQCKPRVPSSEYAFRIKMQCPAAYDATCTVNWKMTGQAIEVKE
ncbi:hypothetical protein [Bradyrhizobium sp. SZCCHNRI1058]|uniref:hypothetical protein n=1 Tax=Bradyrhizobium sp. SZCCHNRI1058 TaxID=3057279 RepID=UPI0029163AF8|nr:hypothetical protein [Bradyrhizobium sp. SZCCHNRI1058]